MFWMRMERYRVVGLCWWQSAWPYRAVPQCKHRNKCRYREGLYAPIVCGPFKCNWSRWIFIDNGPDVNKSDFRGETPLHIAAEHGHLEIITMLVNADANMKAKYDTGRTSLHMAKGTDKKKLLNYWECLEDISKHRLIGVLSNITPSTSADWLVSELVLFSLMC